MKIRPTFVLTAALLVAACSTRDAFQSNLFSRISMIDSIEGNAQYLQSPFVTAGNRVYMVGYQDGSFPELGWHIDGEMGGIWNHPIKLMDGFSARVTIQGTDRSFCLDRADKFINYPYANKHCYRWAGENISIPIYIAGSYESEDAVRSNFRSLKPRADELLQSKAANYARRL